MGDSDQSMTEKAAIDSRASLGLSFDTPAKTLGAHRDTAASHLGGVHKRDALYSARREPRARAQT
jgi:hypothetical protein